MSFISLPRRLAAVRALDARVDAMADAMLAAEASKGHCDVADLRAAGFATEEIVELGHDASDRADMKKAAREAAVTAASFAVAFILLPAVCMAVLP